jgi:hypothetical protein
MEVCTRVLASQNQGRKWCACARARVCTPTTGRKRYFNYLYNSIKKIRRLRRAMLSSIKTMNIQETRRRKSEFVRTRRRTLFWALSLTSLPLYYGQTRTGMGCDLNPVRVELFSVLFLPTRMQPMQRGHKEMVPRYAFLDGQESKYSLLRRVL